VTWERPRRSRCWPAVTVVIAGALGACAGGSHPTLGLDWREGPSLPAAAGVRVEATALLAPAASGQPWIAVGAGHAGPSGLAPLWWTSPDGVTWRAGALHPITPDGPRSALTGVARAGETVAAVGQAYSPIHGNPRALAWRVGPDGALAEVPVLRELFGGENGLGLVGITAGATGFTAAGGYVVDRAGGGSFVAATVWTSSDGVAWSRTEGAVAPPSTPDEIVIARGVTSAGGRRVLFGDSSPIAVEPGRPAVWCATDSGAWQRVPAAQIPAAPGLTTVLRTGGYSAPVGFVLGGIESDPSGAHPAAVAFTSPDCTTWRRRPLGHTTGSVAILDTAAVDRGAVVTWRDATGLHLTAIDAQGVRAVTAPVGGDVTGAHLAGAGPFVVAVIDSAAGTRVFSAAA
jgi:hypothetical protein